MPSRLRMPIASGVVSTTSARLRLGFGFIGHALQEIFRIIAPLGNFDKRVFLFEILDEGAKPGVRVVEGDLALALGACDKNFFAVGALIEGDLGDRTLARWRRSSSSPTRERSPLENDLLAMVVLSSLNRCRCYERSFALSIALVRSGAALPAICKVRRQT